MNKEEFLRILREKLSILDEKEMEDILSEYEQHIDMKTAGAMTEEEAIADFGNPDALAADILEAYHVRSDYAKKSASSGSGMWERFKERLDGMAAKGKTVFLRFGNRCKAGWEHFRDFWRRLHETYFRKDKEGDGTKAGMKAECGGKMLEKSTRAERKEQRMERYTLEQQYSGESHVCGFWKSLWNSLKRGTRSFFEGCRKLIVFSIKAGLWCVKWMWNIGWIMVGGMMGIGTAFCLFFFGALLVIQAQGYPVNGVTIGMAGICLGAISLTGLPFTFLISQKKKKRKKEEMVSVSAPEEEENHA